MSLFCLGFGNDVDYSFLDVMSKQNKGVARRIFEGSDADIQLQVKAPTLGSEYVFLSQFKDFMKLNVNNTSYAEFFHNCVITTHNKMMIKTLHMEHFVQIYVMCMCIYSRVSMRRWPTLCFQRWTCVILRTQWTS